jgi:hypothetical protein
VDSNNRALDLNGFWQTNRKGEAGMRNVRDHLHASLSPEVAGKKRPPIYKRRISPVLSARNLGKFSQIDVFCPFRSILRPKEAFFPWRRLAICRDLRVVHSAMPARSRGCQMPPSAIPIPLAAVR